MKFLVETIIENLPLARNPEGETILRELVHRGGYKDLVSDVRSGKYLRFTVEADHSNEAKEIIFDLCNKLRIFNPIVHKFTISKVEKL